MTDQNPENLGAQGQNPQSEQQQPPAIPQQAAQNEQPAQAQQETARPRYDGQPLAQGQPQDTQSQGQTGAGYQSSSQTQQQQQQGQTQYRSQANYQGQPSYGDLPVDDKPKNSMVMNIIATIVGFLCGGCCIPGIIGVIGIVFSSQVDTKYAQGDMNGALSSAQTAKILGIVSLVLTALAWIGIILYFVFIISVAGFEGFSSGYMDALDSL